MDLRIEGEGSESLDGLGQKDHDEKDAQEGVGTQQSSKEAIFFKPWTSPTVTTLCQEQKMT